jgi:tetratricopeptide (TPR) repeat protein
MLTVRFVDLALRNLADRPFFVLALARPSVHELFPRLWSGRHVQELKLHELSSKASALLIREALGPDVSPSVLERMVQQAAGNAFYLEECIRAAAEGHAEFPATVIAMLQARLERLEPEARQVLRAASVFGQTFWESGAQTLLGGDRLAVLKSWLDLLEDREWIVKRPTGKFPDHAEYMFRHSFLREGAYAMLTDEDRRVGHALAGTWLEVAGEQDAAVLAEHFERGEENAKAATYYARAAVDALRRNDLEGALTRAQRGLLGTPSDETRAFLHWAQAHALWWRGSLEDVTAHALDAIRGLARGSPESWDAVGMIVGSLAQLGRHEETLPWMDLLLVAPPPITSARLIATCAACIALLTAGRFDDADRLLAAVESTRLQCSDLDPMLDAHLHRTRAARALYVAGDLSLFLEEVLLSATSFEQIGDARNACSQRANAGLAYVMLGAYPLAERVLREALATAHDIGIDRMGAVTEHNLGIAIARQGRTVEAIEHELHAIDELRARSDQRVEGGAWTYVAQMRLQAGDVPGAEVAVQKALALLEGFPPIRALALSTLAQVHLAKGAGEGGTADAATGAAMDAAEAARAILVELGTLPGGEDSVRLVYARALEAAGRTEEARVAMRDAYARLTARAAKIADPRWRESFLVNVAENGEIRAVAEAWGVHRGVSSAVG